MLPKVHRLKHRHDFSAVYRGGLRRQSKHLSVRAKRRKPGSLEVRLSDNRDPRQRRGGNPPVPSPEDSSPKLPTRMGISISQKVSKQAVIRNRIKRQLRGACRELLPRIAPGWDVVIVVRPQGRECNYRQLLQELEQLLAQAEVLNGHP
ncbi:ribonuclease P protein component [Oxynema sp. CENA135]|uniref:ribonuclease P protein component n=1 Tax=Oxynema sp. CENA135 TaxID=984206 RepID=UPI0019092639|nr:ribonuclease P protein component [Oxynema sp. CENA135]